MPAADGMQLYVRHGEREWSFAPHQDVMIGRHPRCQIALDDGRVSREHLRVWHTAEGWWLSDLDSRNGTWLEGADRLVEEPVMLQPGTSRIRVGAPDGLELLLTTTPARKDVPPTLVIIGRSRACDVVVDDPLASRQHAAVEIRERTTTLRDLGSFNGTFLNGRPVTTPEELNTGDRIGVGTSTFAWDGHHVVAAEPLRPAFSARHLEVVTRSGARLLEDVTFSAPSGSLVAVIGPSGAGKSTLLGALTGLHPATGGRVMWGGRNLYEEYAQLRFLIGLVPQEDILHRQLTVRRALDYAARLRLPPDTSATERASRIGEVLAEVGLSDRVDHRVDRLSGGQRKRTSIALELLSAPQLLFLDEPTSGLDPGLDRQVMSSLRSLADAGRVVLVVTHSVLALNECDRVLVMAPGGRVAYFGPPEELLEFFDAHDYPTVFATLDDPAWVVRYSGSSARQEYVGRTTVTDVPAPSTGPAPPRPLAPLRQLGTLVRRNLAVLAADRMLVILLVGMPFLLAAMAHSFPGDAGLSLRQAGDDVEVVRQRLIVLVIGAALMGTALSIKDLIGERPIYRRERTVGLSPAAYLLSKVLVLGSLVAAQSVLFTVLALLGMDGPDDSLVLPSGQLEIAAAIAAVGVTMTIAGLVVSALATSSDQTMPALVAIIMAQLVLCGGLFPLTGRSGLEQVSWLLPARFGYAASASTVDLQRPPAPQIDALYDATAEQWLTDLGLLGVQAVGLYVLAAWALRRSVARAPLR